MKHTPGPWTIRFGGGTGDDGFCIASENASCNEVVAECWPVTTTKEDRVRLSADAKLIAAAPELLEALKQVARCDFLGDLSGALLDDCMEISGVDERLRTVLGMVREAITKAEGGQS